MSGSPKPPYEHESKEESMDGNLGFPVRILLSLSENLSRGTDNFFCVWILAQKRLLDFCFFLKHSDIIRNV